jgi:hypothetical protein
VPFSWPYIVSSIRPSAHVFTGVVESQQESQKIYGQVYQSPTMASAHLNYLIQPENSDTENLVTLLEGLIEQAGCWCAKQVIADLATDSDWFPQFRQAGFSVLVKQRMFRFESLAAVEPRLKTSWRTWTTADIAAIRSLYCTLVPSLIQPVEPLTRREKLGLVYYDEKGTLQAYADLVYGPVGVWVLPIIHPQVKEDIPDLLAHMLLDLPELNGRPIYVASRSYQPWVEHALEDLSAEPGPVQALLVRYLALRQRAKLEFSFTPLENGSSEPTIPLAPIKKYPE